MQISAQRAESLTRAGVPLHSQELSAPENFYASALALKVNASAEPGNGAMLNRCSALFTQSEADRLGEWLIQGKTLVTIVLLLAVIISGVSAVYAVHLNRQFFAELQTLQADQDQAQRRWAQLLLEESALNAPNRVEHIASEKLGMVIPDSAQLTMVK